MNKMLPSLLLLGLLGPVVAVATDTATPVEFGRTLFESQTLGAEARSCATCHPGGKGLAQVGDFTDAELKEIINACVRDALHGTQFAKDAKELDALMVYVRTFQTPTR